MTSKAKDSVEALCGQLKGQLEHAAELCKKTSLLIYEFKDNEEDQAQLCAMM